ncbi:MAG: hypothetical protein L0Z62_25040 [Gemmataceae bacterium]|nr:hypothetical protein [Gemmataceae bacterium]
MSHDAPRPFALLATLVSASVALALLDCAAPPSNSGGFRARTSERRADVPTEDRDPLAPVQLDRARPGEALPAQRPARAHVEFRQVVPGALTLSAAGAHALALPHWLSRLGSAPQFTQPSRRVLFCTWLA